MQQTIAILGRQPDLGIAELESLYGAKTLQPFGEQACLIDLPVQDIDFDRIGGSTRIARVLNILPSNSWRDIEKYLIDTTPKHAEYIQGKLSFGISVYGVKVTGAQVSRTALLIKKAIRQAGVSVRMVPQKSLELGSATVLYNKLTGKNGWELLIVSDGKTTLLCQTAKIQDIDAYSARDQARPFRDAKVGMLPPKLAQILINLAVGHTVNDERRTMNDEELQLDHRTSNIEPHDSRLMTHDSNFLILDPFCGTGVVLQEAMLMNYDIYGSDIEPRMVQYSIDNLKWLDALYPKHGDYRRVEIGDATAHKWNNPEAISAVAAETYLGQPLSTLPSSDHLSKIMYDVNLLHHKFLQNIGSQIRSGTRLCLAVPAWRGKHEFLHLPMLDHLTDMGYTRARFKHVSDNNLIYHREGQIVGRELLVIIKN